MDSRQKQRVLELLDEAQFILYNELVDDEEGILCPLGEVIDNVSDL